MGRVMLLLLAAIGLVACAPSPRAVNPAPPGISYRFQGDDVAAANQRAAEYCRQYGKEARLQAVKPSGSDRIAIYDCT